MENVLPAGAVDAAAAAQPVHTIMTSPPPVVEPHDALRDVARELVTGASGAALVVGPLGAVGIVSDRDVSVVAGFGGGGDEPVRTVMSTTIVAAAPTDTIGAVGRLMVDEQVRHVAVRSGTEIVGLVSVLDVLAALLA